MKELYFRVGNRDISISMIEIVLIYIFSIMLTINGVYNPMLLGRPLFSFLFLILSVIAFFKSFSIALHERFWTVIILSCLSIICSAFSIIQGWDWFSSVFNSMVYLTPFLFVIIPLAVDFNKEKMCRCVQIMTLLAAGITILIYMGYIDTGLGAYGYRLNIRVVDNSIGLLGLATSFYMIFLGKAKPKYLSYITLILSYIIIFFGQSRARVILATVITALFVFYSIFLRKENKLLSFLSAVLVFVIMIIVVSRYYNLFSEYITVVTGKLNTIFEDSSSTYRIDEVEKHLELLKEQPLLGIGFGALNHSYNMGFDNVFYGHNMFSSAFALGGFLYGCFFIIAFTRIFVKTIRSLIIWKTLDYFYSFILLIVVVFLSITSAGFVKYSTHIMMLMVGIFTNSNHESNKV